MARYLWWTGVAIHVVFAVWTLAADLLLLWAGGETETDYLRSHPAAFWVPLCIALVGLLVLFLHLYVFTPVPPLNGPGPGGHLP